MSLFVRRLFDARENIVRDYTRRLILAFADRG